MIEESHDNLLSSHQIGCRGSGPSGMHFFPQDQAEPVIIKVYKNGKTEPLCRYAFVGVVPRCDPTPRKVSARFTEDSLGVCPYATDH